MIQNGTAVRVVGMTSGKKELNGALGRCLNWDSNRGVWLVGFGDAHQAPIKPENLEIADHTGAADEFLGWCQMPSKKFSPDGFDGVLDLHQSGSSNSLLRVHVDPQALGEILTHSEFVTDEVPAHTQHHAPKQELRDWDHHSDRYSVPGSGALGENHWEDPADRSPMRDRSFGSPSH